MRCNDCQRHNGSNYQYCVHCGAVLANSLADQPGKVVVPPQTIDELISERDLTRAYRQKSRLHPVIVVGLALLIGVSGVYYLFFYRDIYQILAIDYGTSELVDGR